MRSTKITRVTAPPAVTRAWYHEQMFSPQPIVLKKLSRLGALIAYWGLFALWMAWPTQLAPPAVVPVAWVLLTTVTPLLLPLRGFLHGRPRSHVWLAFLSLAYFVHGVLEIAAKNGPWGAVETVLSLVLFFCCAIYVRAAGKC